MIKIVKLILPPIVPKVWKKVKAVIIPPPLFNGDSSKFKTYLQNCNVYGEYGCGQSTEWVALNTSCSIYSVDSSKVWIDLVTKKVGNDVDKLQMHHADIGPIGNWGKPLDYTSRANFSDYTNWLWEQDKEPDVVLIDGRFRVACFLTSLLRSKVGTLIIFDDYIKRDHYHIVEEFAKIKELDGRQAIFTTPELSTEERLKAEQLLEKFQFVMD